MKRKQINKRRVDGGESKNGLSKRVVALFGMLVMGVCISIIWSKHYSQMRMTELAASADLNRMASSLTLKELLTLPSSEIERCDIALMNLLCAQGLPGAEELNMANCLLTLDGWANHVRAETERNFHQFRDNPADYYYSEGYFRLLMMSVVMYEDYNIRYNPARIVMPGSVNPGDHFFADSSDVFLHGLLGNRRMGTCSSMPVLYIAIGRRLGYPLKLVTTKAHLFVRWEDGMDRFNVEATGKGMNRYDDEHFKRWPFPVSDEEIKTEGFLKSLSPSEEFAVFLSLRGNCLKEAGRNAEAANCYAAASRLTPGWNAYRALLADINKDVNATASQVVQPTPSQVIVQQMDKLPSGMPGPNPLLNIQ